MQKPIDLDRCRKGMKQLDIRGVPRPALIEEAIQRIQADAKTAMRHEYLGIKNYASFGDQREDHRYGFGPKHGAIVFEIGRTSELQRDVPLDADAIYLLECARDFGAVDVENECATSSYERVARLNLCGVIRKLDAINSKRNMLLDAIQRVNVEAHV